MYILQIWIWTQYKGYNLIIIFQPIILFNAYFSRRKEGTLMLHKKEKRSEGKSNGGKKRKRNLFQIPFSWKIEKNTPLLQFHSLCQRESLHVCHYFFSFFYFPLDHHHSHSTCNKYETHTQIYTHTHQITLSLVRLKKK